MASEAVNKYIEKRYERWLDYPIYLCSQNGMVGEEIDVLNEVLYMLLQKDSDYLDDLLSRKKGLYTELDSYVLQMIKLNITSDTAPYKHKYKAIPKDENADWQTIDVLDEEYEDNDKSEKLLSMFDTVRDIFESLQLNDFARRVFFFRFFEDESFSDWPGNEDRKTLNETYGKVTELIKEKLFGKTLF
jgi:hypothetical protein